MPAHTTINNDLYDDLGELWYTANDDPVALLRAEARAHGPWIRDQLRLRCPLPRPQVLDVGCGGGFNSNYLAEHSFAVTGVDLSEESLAVATRYDSTNTVNYIRADAYELPFADNSFDAVIAMDFLEHVEDPARVIAEVSRVLRPKGTFFFHTFNRNLLSRLVIIKLVEWLLPKTPKNLHIYRMFIKPQELREHCEDSGMSIVSMQGLAPQLLNLDVLRGALRGVVPANFRFRFVRSLALSYSGFAQKK